MCNKCRMRMIELAGKPPKIEGLEPELVRVANLIYNGKLKPGQIDKAMVKKIAGQLMQGVFKGYGKTLDAKDLTPAERNFLTNVNQNIHVFSGFKNYQQLKEATLLIKDDDGKLKSFRNFFEDFKQLDVTYNEVYQSAEWGNCVASAQNAASWNDFINNGVEVLTFQTAEDDRVRPEHAMMNGMTASIDSPVLNTYFTPLDWGCRCEWIPGEEKNIKDAEDYTLPDIPKMFQNNVGKTGIVFPESHPYFEASKKDSDFIKKQVEDITPTNIEPLIPENLPEYEKKLGVDINNEIFDYTSEPTKLTFNDGGAYYNRQTNTVNISIDNRKKSSKWNAQSVVYHEFGHAADFQNGYQKLDIVKDLMSDYKNKFKGDFLNLTSDLRKELTLSIANKDHDSIEQITAAMDTIMSLDKNYGAGHSYKVLYRGNKVDYFDIPGFKEAEFIAHAFENRFLGNPIFKKHMPGLYEDMIKLTNVFKRK